MPPRERGSIPDSLDPLVDTLSNVVGILVIVVALTQLQLGDALIRVVELDSMRHDQERIGALMPSLLDQQEKREDALIRRTDADVGEAIDLAREILERLSELAPAEASQELEAEGIQDMQIRLEMSKQTLADHQRLRDQRTRTRSRLQSVPKRLVARLPDPQVIRGRESWILARHGRLYLTDREELFRRGSHAIHQILQVGSERRIRADEFASVARYLRKRDVGQGSFRWQLQTEPDIRVQLAWRSPDSGLDPGDPETRRALRSWLASRSPDVDFINFHVWGDSFEAYLAAREIVEASGFRAGWRGHEIDHELDLGLRFGAPESPIRSVEVD